MKLSTADYALIVSLCSAAISLAGFVWNVWSKFIYPKAKLKVGYVAICIIQADDVPGERPLYVTINVTNFGPTDVTIRAAYGAFRHGLFKRRFAYINPIHNVLDDPEVGVGPFGGGLPKTLKVGEEFSLYFPYSAQTFSRGNLTQVGVCDGFSRRHRASRKQIRKVKAELDEAFRGVPYTGVTSGGD